MLIIYFVNDSIFMFQSFLLCSCLKGWVSLTLNCHYCITLKVFVANTECFRLFGFNIVLHFFFLLLLYCLPLSHSTQRSVWLRASLTTAEQRRSNSPSCFLLTHLVSDYSFPPSTCSSYIFKEYIFN